MKSGSGGFPERGAGYPGPPWRGFLADPDEGLGSVYERFALWSLLERSVRFLGARSLLHAPLFGMTGIPGLETLPLARGGLRVGLVDVDPERLEAVRGLWLELGMEPETFLLPWPPSSGWADSLPAGGYDMAFSFASLWWFPEPRVALEALARWTRLGVLICLPNPSPFLRLRLATWGRRESRLLRLEVLDREVFLGLAREARLILVREGFFDLPPFPDTALPLRRLVSGVLPRLAHPARRSGFWRWSALPYLRGENPGLERVVRGLSFLEMRSPAALVRLLAHHRYFLLAKAGVVPGPGR